MENICSEKKWHVQAAATNKYIRPHRSRPRYMLDASVLPLVRHFDHMPNATEGWTDRHHTDALCLPLAVVRLIMARKWYANQWRRWWCGMCLHCVQSYLGKRWGGISKRWTTDARMNRPTSNCLYTFQTHLEDIQWITTDNISLTNNSSDNENKWVSTQMTEAWQILRTCSWL